MTEPFYRRIWFWAIVAPPLLLGAAWATSLFIPLWPDGERVTVTFTRFTGTPDGPVYNMTEKEAASLPGNLPYVLNRAGQVGMATAEFSSTEDFKEVTRAVQFSRYIRYQGVVLHMGLGMAMK